MAKITNAPKETLQLDLERRKSFAFRLIILAANGLPVDLTGCRLRFVLKTEEWDDDHYDLTNLVVNQYGAIPSGDGARQGYAIFSLQAAELDRDPGTYYGAIVLWTAAGYSSTLVKVVVRLLENTESDSMHLSYASATPPSDVELTLRGDNVVTLRTSNPISIGEKGAPGLSAYEVAVAGGYAGSEAAWLASLVGDPGAAGLSAYEVAVAEGFVGDEAAWLASLVGAPGAGAVSSVNGQTGAVVLTIPDSPDDIGAATAAQGAKADSASQPGHTHTLDQVGDTATRLAMTPTERTKLGGVASGATANATDAQLRDRSTHTGAQAISTVTGLQAALDGKQPAGSYASSVHTHDDRYYTEAEVDAALAGKAASTHSHAVTDVTGLQAALDGKAPTSHTHDDRYYTEAEVDAALAGKADASHTHGVPLRTIVTTASTSITAASGDHGKLIQTTAATAVTVELPAGLPVGTQIEYQASGAGLATFTLGASASWSPAPTPSAVMRAQGSAVAAVCVATNAWTLIGDLA